MALQFETGVRNAMNNAITSGVGTSGNLIIYSGSVPANVAAAAGTVLCTLPCSATFAPASSGGTLTVNAITTANCSATGTAAYFRIATSGGTAIVQGTVGTSGTDLIVSTTSLVSGAPISVSSFTITAAGA